MASTSGRRCASAVRRRVRRHRRRDVDDRGDRVPQRAVGVELRHAPRRSARSAPPASCSSPGWRRLLLGESVALSAVAFVAARRRRRQRPPDARRLRVVRPRPRRRLGRPAVERPAGRHHRSAAGPAVHRRLAGRRRRRRDRPPLPPARPAGDRPDPGPRPEPAVHGRGALAGPAPGRRHPGRHAGADHRRPAARPAPDRRRRSATSSTPARRRRTAAG